MNNQAKRWTAIDRGIYHGKDLVACGNKVWGKLSDDCATATRLAACADLLRGVDDLTKVAVMTWVDVERIREELTWLSCHGHAGGFARACAGKALAILPKPARSETKGEVK